MCQIGSEIGDEAGHLFALGNAPQWDAARGERIRVLARDFHVPGHRVNEAGPTLGADWPRIDRDEAYILLSVLRGEGKRQVLPGSIGRTRRDLPIRRFPIRLTTRPRPCFCMIGSTCLRQRT
jgi:hypothetical protein